MGFRFRRSVKILPGVRVNLSGSGASVSLGARGFHYTIGPKGTRVTAGIPGTGLSWTQYSPYSSKHSDVQDILPPPLNIHSAEQQSPDPLQTIQNASAREINSLSTSEIAPILNSANRRVRLAPAVQLLCVLLFVATLLQANQLWIGLSALFATVFVPTAIFLDHYRRSVKINFEPEGVIARIAEALSVAFTELTRSEAIWIVHAEGRTGDWKRNAGATSLIRRKRTRLQFNRPRCIRGRTKFPSFQIGPDELYLLPDAALVIVNGEVASVIDLSDAQNVRWVQSRLQEFGFLRERTAGWDSFSRSALRDFKAANNLGTDEKWDFKTEELLASGSALHAEQTFVGSWSEASCEPGARPDIVISSRRAVSSAGGTCEFSNLKSTGAAWSVVTACSNAGEKWTATIRLAMSGGKLIWTGRNGNQTQYSRCQ
jgi:hypothetical protein